MCCSPASRSTSQGCCSRDAVGCSEAGDAAGAGCPLLAHSFHEAPTFHDAQQGLRETPKLLPESCPCRKPGIEGDEGVSLPVLDLATGLSRPCSAGGELLLLLSQHPSSFPSPRCASGCSQDGEPRRDPKTSTALRHRGGTGSSHRLRWHLVVLRALTAPRLLPALTLADAPL